MKVWVCACESKRDSLCVCGCVWVGVPESERERESWIQMNTTSPSAFQHWKEKNMIQFVVVWCCCHFRLKLSRCSTNESDSNEGQDKEKKTKTTTTADCNLSHNQICFKVVALIFFGWIFFSRYDLVWIGHFCNKLEVERECVHDWERKLLREGREGVRERKRERGR